MKSQSHILWQSDDKNITLLDVPGSIAAAQGTDEHPHHGDLVSSVPPQMPFPSNEPRSPAARAKLALSPAARLMGEEYCRLLEDAIKQVCGHYYGPWCLPRPHTTAAPRGEKRKAGSLDDGMDLPPATQAPSMREVADAPPDSIRVRVESLDGGVVEGEMCKGRFHFVTDDHEASQVTADDRPGYRMPARSCAVLDDCVNTDVFHKAVTTQAERDGSRPEFDFVLLDPPWPSRSVKRTHKTAGSTYATIATVEELKALLLGTRLDTLMADGCLVGMWITNKPAARDLVLGHGGIFGQWGLSLTEEWIWLKTTAHGEPVTQLDGLWRRPYEVLLLGRKQGEHSASTRDSSNVVRRVILGVPDLHSRKPCLKSLIEEKWRMLRATRLWRSLHAIWLPDGGVGATSASSSIGKAAGGHERHFQVLHVIPPLQHKGLVATVSLQPTIVEESSSLQIASLHCTEYLEVLEAVKLSVTA